MSEKLLTKKEILQMFNLKPTNPKRKEIFNQLPKYQNPFNSRAIFKQSDALMLLESLKQ